MTWKTILKDEEEEEMDMFEQERLNRRRLTEKQIDAALTAVGVKGGMNNFSDPDRAVDELIERLQDHLKDVPPPDMSEYDGPDEPPLPPRFG